MNESGSSIKPMNMLASDADRERIREIIATAFHSGRLTADEFAERIDALFQSRTFEDLRPLVADIPQQYKATPSLQSVAELERRNTQQLMWLLVAFSFFAVIASALLALGDSGVLVIALALTGTWVLVSWMRWLLSHRWVRPTVRELR